MSEHPITAEAINDDELTESQRAELARQDAEVDAAREKLRRLVDAIPRSTRSADYRLGYSNGYGACLRREKRQADPVRVQALIATWREDGPDAIEEAKQKNLWVTAAMIKARLVCADELDALVRASSPPPPVSPDHE
jgi:hypothetical protein